MIIKEPEYKIVEEADYLLIFMRPLYNDSLVYKLTKVDSSDKKIEFKTATTNMRTFVVDEKIIVEHLDVDGKINHIVYKDCWSGNLNFVNIGWQGNWGRKYLRIDVYTGEYAIIED